MLSKFNIFIYLILHQKYHKCFSFNMRSRNKITYKERLNYFRFSKRRPHQSGIEFIDEGRGDYLTVSRCFFCLVETLKVLIIVRVTDGVVFDKKG